ncbi:MAG: hypothetical protein ACYDA5_01545 [Vulcanimicrobiaceae bacterium]
MRRQSLHFLPRQAFAMLALAGAALIALPALAACLDGAVIVNSGSTNFNGWRIKFWSNGMGQVVAMRDGKPVDAPRAFRVPRAATARFFADTQAARDAHAAGMSCMKSASFGTTTRVVWHTWTSPDVSCPQRGPNLALARDASVVISAAKVSSLPLRAGRIQLYKEPRRLPASTPPSGNASPSR